MRITGSRGTVELLNVKPPAVAGMFYPADAGALRREVRAFLAAARPAGDAGRPKALIAPHAGYRYSGPVAASGYARLAGANVRRVVLLGPAHRVPVRGLAVSGAAAFATPLGQVRVDTAAVQAALRFPQVQRLDAAFAQEHSLEVHLPFLLEVLPEFELLPMLVGEAGADEVAEVLEAFWGGPETAIVVSSDLSHYHDYETAQRLDTATCRAIEALDGGAIGHHDACGRHAVIGLLAMAKRHGLQATTVDLRNSGDTSGPRDRVVGYGSWVLEPEAARLPLAERRWLLGAAAAAIRHGLAGGEPRIPDLADCPPRLREQGASFVTLKRDGALRGCIGTLQAGRPLAEDVAHNAHRAAFSDPRFPALTEAEMAGLDVSVAVLGEPEPMRFRSEPDLVRQLRPGVDGLILRDGERRGTFLPAVWEGLPQPEAFVRQLKRKAGLAEDHWSDTLRVSRYSTESFS